MHIGKLHPNAGEGWASRRHCVVLQEDGWVEKGWADAAELPSPQSAFLCIIWYMKGCIWARQDVLLYAEHP